MQYTRQQLAESVKSKYPQYSAVDNEELADSILKKYPQYKSRLDDGGIIESAGNYARIAAAGAADFGYATLEGVASGISRLTGDSDLVKTVSDFRNYSKEFYEGSVPEDVKQSFGGKATRAIAQAPFYMTTAATGLPGLAVLTANAYQQGRDDYLSTQGVTSLDASEEQLKEADKVGAFSAIPIVALERIGASKLVDSLFKGQSKITIREATKRIGTSAVGEGLTEGSQTIFQNTLASELMNYDPNREVTQDVLESILLGAVVGGAITSPVVGYQAYQDRAKSPEDQVVEQGLDPDTDLTYTLSYTNPNNGQQSILNVQAASPENAVELATVGLGNRAVDIKYEGINTSDLKKTEDVSETFIDGVKVPEGTVPTEAEQAELQQELQEELDQSPITIDQVIDQIEVKDVTAEAARVPSVMEKALPLYKKIRNKEQITAQESRELASIIDKEIPVEVITEQIIESRPILSSEQMKSKLMDNKLDLVGRENFKIPIEDGTFVGLRLDIPAYEKPKDKGDPAFIVTVHDASPTAESFQAGTVAGYDSAAVINNATFGIGRKATGQKAVLGIASGKAKGTIATMRGNYENISPEQAYSELKENLNNPEWTQVGMDPERRGYFYDRKTMKEVVSADRAIQVGKIVLAKNAKFGPTPPNEFVSRLTEDLVKGQPDVTAGAAPVTQPASVKLTQKETEFFDELLGNEANRAELLEEVSSLKIVDGRLSIEPTDIQNLNNFISDVAISDGLGTVPPRLKSNQFYPPFFKTEPDVTAEAAPTEPTGPYSPSTLGEFITKDFTPIAKKIGTDIVADESVELAQYNASKGLIEYNPTALSQQDKQYITAVMREEIIHGAISKVILQQSKLDDEGEAFIAFMSDVADSMTADQVAKMQQVYLRLVKQPAWKTASEFTRVGLQKGLYGNITESFISKGPAFDKIKKLLKTVQSYLARTLGSEVDSNPEAAGVIRAAAELLQQADPSARLINQNIVQKAKAMSAPVYPNSDYGFAVQGEPFNERIEDVSTFKKYALTMNGLLADIDPALKRFSTRYYYSIESKSLDRLRASLPFVQKYRGIKKKSKKDFKRLKRLLLFSEASVTDQGQAFVQERDELLKKYGMYNDFQLGPRFVLDEILDEGTNAGVEIGKVYDYMPRFINDLEKVKNFYGKTTKTGFREYIQDPVTGQNARIKEARETMDKLQDEGKSVPADVRLLANKEIIKIGNKETAYFEAIYFDDYLSQQGFKKPKGTTPSSIKERTVGVRESELIPEKIIDAYDDIDVALERYIYNMTSSLETLRFIGRRYTYENNGIQINKNQVPSELSVLLREQVAANRITEEQATGIIPDIFQRATKVRKQEAAPVELLRSLGYISGLVELTSTLSQLLDTTFVTVRNNPLTTISAILNTTVTGQMVGVDVEQIASEFVQDKTARTKSSRTARVADLSNKSVRKLLKTTGFIQLDIRMKNANLTANFNRYRKLANEYYKDRNSKKSKLFISELTYLGLSPNEQIQFIAQLKKFKPGKPDAQQFRNAPLVREVLFGRLQETQPMSKGSRPLAALEDPNKNILYMMKSFMVSQMNNARSEIIKRIFDTRLSGLERRRAVTDLLRLLAGLLAIGIPVSALKDFIAGRFGYLNDYAINALLSPLGISTYTGYKIQREGIGGAAFSYLFPVSLQMARDMLFIMQKLMNGQKVQPKDITAFAPYSEIINRVSGFNTEPQLRKFKRKKKEGQRPIVIPSEIRVPQGIF